ncbi:hypothetical protein U724_27975 [Pseudomonas chlororaphis subsp. aurantiaca PB-St2]|nr:hypothetical protein U724_27975 [Pseudomonas chlororaphis subsp. aurantiaca PB-St2]
MGADLIASKPGFAQASVGASLLAIERMALAEGQ